MPSWTFNNTSTGNTGTIQSWTVPTTGAYRIDAYGAQGGNSWDASSVSQPGGYGARIRADLNLTANHVIKILVGQKGVSNADASRGAGGGGGTFIYNQTTGTLLLVAGGGGGMGNYGLTSNAHASATTTANPGATTTTPSGSGAGGTGGAGGGAGPHAGGGAGWSSSGADGTGTTTVTGGASYNNGGAGGVNYSTLDNVDGTANSNGKAGGFGGGGGAYAGGGGGGGYSGGGGGNWSNSGAGGGGGSYYDPAGTNLITTAGNRTGQGIVLIASAPSVTTPTNLTMYSATLNAVNCLGTSTFEYGTTTSYGTSVSFTGTGGTDSVNIVGLSRGTVYHCRVTSSGVLSSDFTFTTKDGSVLFTNSTPTNVTVNSMTLNATITGVNE